MLTFKKQSKVTHKEHRKTWKTWPKHHWKSLYWVSVGSRSSSTL